MKKAGERRMEIRRQDNIRKLLADITLPRMVKVRQRFDRSAIGDVAGTLRQKLDSAGIASRIRPGMSVVLTGSGREIANMNVILRETVSFIRDRGALPFIVPAMGSHGSSTAEGQKEILSGYGITEEFCGCPVRSSMDTVLLGHTADGDPVYLDTFAHRADAIVAVGRIKPHTAFRGKYESGLMKMLAVGLGKQKGADSIHRLGFGPLKDRIPAFASVVMEKHRVLFGVGVIENAFKETCRLEVLRGEEIPEKEPALLEYAKTRMAAILFPEADVLVVRTIGKNYSGSGMDPNISGTWATPFGGGGIRKQRTVVLDLDDKSHGNSLGAGMADFTTLRLFRKIDFTALYPNGLTSTVIEPCKIPMVLENDEMAIRAAVKTCTGIDRNKVRMVMIRNTTLARGISSSRNFQPLPQVILKRTYRL
ncbi:MAG: DUF2088 domain-containing protein [Synergistales bacterium]|nr:DUF2088 domain-containing protein [Synergistales bacterium]